MSWIDLYFLTRQMTTDWRIGGRTCFAALVSAFLYHERFHTSNAVDHLVRTRRFKYRKAYRKIEKFLHRKTMNLDEVWQWLWDHYTAQIKDCFVLIDWTMWRDGRQVLMAALAHCGRCLPFLAVAYQVKKVLRSQNQAEHAFFLLLSLLKRSNQQITVMWCAAMVAYALRMAAGASVVKKDKQAQFNWTKKGPRRSLLSVGRNAISSGLLKSDELIKQLPKLAIRLVDLKLVEVEKPAKSRARAAGATS